MKKKIICSILSCLIVAALAFTFSAKGAVGKEKSPANGNWWDKFGKPEYGGTLTWRAAFLGPGFNNDTFFGGDVTFWWEPLWTKPNNMVDRNDWSFITEFTPVEYAAPVLAVSWEQPDLRTVIVHLRQGVHWQDKPPVNGREFTAYDVEHHYDRMLGTGSGYTEGPPMYRGMVSNWDKVRAMDKYTVEFKFKNPSVHGLLSIMDPVSLNRIEAPEWVALGGPPSSAPPPAPPKGGPPKGGPPKGGPPSGGGPLYDWHNAVGTGPWILADYVTNSTMAFKRNPNYWGYDERYPENKLPYADTLKLLSIPDPSTAMAALRTGKIDLMTELSWQQAKVLEESSPKLKKQAIPWGSNGVAFRNDHEPFTDIKVRKALQLAIDREAIAKSYYGGTVDGTPSGFISKSLKQYCYAYEEWPQSLKDEYSYDPERARQFLAEAGYPDGFKTDCVVGFNGDVQLLQVMKAMFADIGVTMDIIPMDPVASMDFIAAGKHQQMCTAGGAFTWPPTRFISLFYSKGRDAITYGVKDAEYDALNDAFWGAATQAEAAEICRQADKYVLEKHWQVLAVDTNTYTFWQPYLEGFAGDRHAGFWGQEYLWTRMWIDHEMKKSMGR